MVSGRISFIGAGPGAADLITLRGANRIAEADIVVWAASLVTPECVRDHARSDAELVDSSRMTHEHALEIYRRAEQEKLKVARVHSGDPSLWGAVQEQYDACVRMNVEVEIVPGVAAFSAAAAAVGRELTVPEVAQSLVLTRLEGGKTPMPEGEKVREFAKHGTTMALFLSAARTGQLVDELRAGGYSDDTPVLVAYKVTWPDELLLRTTIGELEATVKEHKLWRHTLYLVGEGLTAGGTRSHLYHAGHFHTFRRADRNARRELREQRKQRSRGGAEATAGRQEGSAAAESAPAARQVESAARQVESEEATAPAAETAPVTGTAPAEGKAAAGGKTTAEASAENRAVDPDVAWWAVREWQEEARSGQSSAARGNQNRPRAARADEAQSELFGVGAEEGGSTAADTAAVADTAAGSGTAAEAAPEVRAERGGATGSEEASASGAADAAGSTARTAGSGSSAPGKSTRTGKGGRSTKSGGGKSGKRRSAANSEANSAKRDDQ
ncbi:precorrin-4 C(11)-methyltransferase [Salinifilum ghardaiensis]